MRSVSREIAGRTLTLETGWMAKQAHGCVVATYGETVVMSTVVDGGPRDLPFFPLTVDYREKPSAAGKIPGGFFKREGRPTTKEVLAMRLTDRSVRPMFAAGYKNEVQVMSSVLSFDQENEPEALSMVAAFAAMHISSIPCEGPMSAVRLGWIDGNVIINPTRSILQSDANRLDLILAGTGGAISMVEAGVEELTEADLVTALQAGHDVVKILCEMVAELRSQVGVAKTVVTAPVADTEMLDKIRAAATEAKLWQAVTTRGKFESRQAIGDLRSEVLAQLAPDGDSDEGRALQARVKDAFREYTTEVQRAHALKGERTDGRGAKDIRPIDIELGILPRAHGSALFTRGETQSIVTLTLGSTDDEQIIDGMLQEEERRRFLLHYNFPPFCVGEAKPIRGTSRREYGHGALAERALKSQLPDYEDFAYTIRIVSDILESNGSSSMATVCGSSLAMMEGGVPLKAPVAGIAMGLIADGDRYQVLSDILGGEDHYGDMDFKVAGTRKGITALQMDIKVKGLSGEILTAAMEQAREGRLHILDKMTAAIDRPRTELSAHAPMNKSIKIPAAKIGFLIGPKGANIRKMQEEYGVGINIVDDEGNVQVSGNPPEKVHAAIEAIRQMTRVIAVGERFKGRVTSVKPFGCFVDLGGGQEGMCHISELDEGRVNEVTDICDIGDEIDVVVVEVDDGGKIRISRRVALLPDDKLEEAIRSAARPGRGGGGGRPPRRDDRGGRGGDRGGRGGGDRGGYGDRGGSGDRERSPSGSSAPA
ncbi:MAG TPA: polyribonucleotide nucleotidyltransferase [Planctomycetota bacterium]